MRPDHSIRGAKAKGPGLLFKTKDAEMYIWGVRKGNTLAGDTSIPFRETGICYGISHHSEPF